MKPLGSMLSGLDQLPPLYLSAWPLLVTATQRVADGHDTEFTPFAPTPAGLDQVIPLKVSDVLVVTARQNVLDTHETALRMPDPVSVALPQLAPPNRKDWPESLTAMQNAVFGQDTDRKKLPG